MKILLIVILIAFIAIYFTTSIRKNLKIEMNSVQIDYKDSDVSSLSIKVAVIGDIHLGEGKDITKFLNLLDEVKSNNIREQIIKNSPEDNEDFFVVPKVVE